MQLKKHIQMPMWITSELVTQIKKYIHFWKAPNQGFRMMYHLSGFDDVSIFP